MSVRPQVAPAIGYPPSLFEKETASASRAQIATAVSCPTSVLLVGRSGSWGAPMLKSLERLRAELSFAAPHIVTPEYVREKGYGIILLDSTVPAEQRRLLASELTGSSASIFYTFPVENGCWWLPALQRGEECHGAPAFRRKEFASELERALLDRTEV